MCTNRDAAAKSAKALEDDLKKELDALLSKGY